MEGNGENAPPVPLRQDLHATFLSVILSFPTTFYIAYPLN